MRALITGAQGFTGRYLIAHWLALDPEAELFGLGRSSRNDETFTHQITKGKEGMQAPLPAAIRNAFRSPRYTYVSADLLDRPALTSILRKLCPHIIVHLASGLRDDPSEHLFRTNVLGTENLFHAVAELGLLCGVSPLDPLAPSMALFRTSIFPSPRIWRPHRLICIPSANARRRASPACSDNVCEFRRLLRGFSPWLDPAKMSGMSAAALPHRSQASKQVISRQSWRQGPCPQREILSM